MSAGVVSGISSGHRLDVAIPARIEDGSSGWRNLVRSGPRRSGIYPGVPQSGTPEGRIAGGRSRYGPPAGRFDRRVAQ